MGKVRRIDWSPAEWLSGTRGVLTMDEIAVYDVVLNVIYDRGSAAPNDAAFIGGHFKAEGEHTQARSAVTARTRRAIDQLLALDKLRLSNDEQWLTNGRATTELGRASRRMDDAASAGVASGRARRAARALASPQASPHASSGPARHPARSKSSHTNGLARTRVPIITTNHQSSHRDTESVPAREPSPEPQASQARAQKGPEPFRPTAPKTETQKRLQEAAAAARRKLLGGGS